MKIKYKETEVDIDDFHLLCGILIISLTIISIFSG